MGSNNPWSDSADFVRRQQAEIRGYQQPLQPMGSVRQAAYLQAPHPDLWVRVVIVTGHAVLFLGIIVVVIGVATGKFH